MKLNLSFDEVQWIVDALEADVKATDEVKAKIREAMGNESNPELSEMLFTAQQKGRLATYLKEKLEKKLVLARFRSA